jgi:hypothetical protein
MTRQSDGVTFEAAGKSWTVRLDARAWIEVEDATGLGLNEAAQAIMNKGSFKTVCMCMMAGLRHQDAGITLDTVLDLAGEIGNERLLIVVGEALAASFPSAKGKVGNALKDQIATAADQAAGTGISS